ncbi:MAG TPA: hypothetical protein VNA68_03310 [Candidatus Dormibacteraeota bacterium]|nr:hypothetical protein [Candidatus Dormibacteraeota bacterium]
MKRRIKNQHGLTLIELIVTASFVAAAAIAVAEIFITVGNLTRQARNISSATATAQEKIEVYRDAGYASIPTGSSDFTSTLPTGLGSPKSGTAVVVEAPPGLKRVDILITYTEGKKAKKVQVTTYITQRGINR